METLESRLEALEKKVSELEGKEEWPQWGDWYWYLGTRGSMSKMSWGGNTIDCETRDFLGIYRTEDEAEEMREKIREFVRRERGD